MLTENTAPVSLAEGHAVVTQLRELFERSELNGQTLFAFVFQMSGEALAESLDNAADMVGDGADEGHAE